MSKNKKQVLFRKAFRGYNKKDVNAYIEKRSSDFLREKEELDTENELLKSQLATLTDEKEHLEELLVESDKALFDSKNRIEELTARLCEMQGAFGSLRDEVDGISSRIGSSLLASNDKPKESEKPKMPEKPQQKPEKHEKSNDASALTSALKGIKDKILSFLK